MNCNCNTNQTKPKYRLVAGNTAHIVIAVQSLRLENGEGIVEDYIIQESDSVAVRLLGSKTYVYEDGLSFDGKYIYIEDNATIGVGVYDLEVLIKTASGSQYRSCQPNVLEAVRYNANDASMLNDDDINIDAEIVLIYADGKLVSGGIDLITSTATATGVNVTIAYSNGKSTSFTLFNGKDADIASINAAIKSANNAAKQANEAAGRANEAARDADNATSKANEAARSLESVIAQASSDHTRAESDHNEALADRAYIDSLTIPTKVSQLENDSKYVTNSEMTDYGINLYNTINQKLEKKQDRLTTAQLANINADHSQYAKVSDLPLKVSELENDANYVTEDDLAELEGNEGSDAVGSATEGELTDYNVEVGLSVENGLLCVTYNN